MTTDDGYLRRVALRAKWDDLTTTQREHALTYLLCADEKTFTQAIDFGTENGR